MTKHEAQEALRLIRNQLDKLPIDTTEHLQNAYQIVYEFSQAVEESK